MEYLVKEKGINSFKMFMAYKGALMIDDESIMKIFQICKRLKVNFNL
jgi:dihydropyrimidinase